MGQNRSVLTFKMQHAFFDFAVLLTVLLCYFLFHASHFSSVEVYVPYAAGTLLIWLFTIYFFGGYDFFRIFHIAHNFRLMIISCVSAAFVSGIFGYFHPTHFSALGLHYTTFLFVLVFYLSRLIFTKIIASRLPERNVLVYGAGWAGKEILAEIQNHHFLKYKVVGFVDDDPDRRLSIISGVPVLGTNKELASVVASFDIDTVVFAITRRRDSAVMFAKSWLHEMDVDTVEMPELYERITGRVPVLHVNNTWHDFYTSLKHRQPYLIYRLYNIFLSLFFFIVFLPVIPFVIFAIKFTSKGPVLYKQVRVGRKEKLFTLYKFRSMRIDAEKFGAQWAQANDPRLTRIGGFLRATRLDELPQLINVLKGDMNFVGPRPERPEFVKDLNKEIPFYRSRHQVAPGLTGWAQVRMGYASSVEDSLKKLQYDLYYIKHRNLFLDFLILVKTVQVVLTRQGT
jgi:exopolysaccharide biosynthesis polyprenyl glycosylphosphotransferase